jgi:hypothetical protein
MDGVVQRKQTTVDQAAREVIHLQAFVNNLRTFSFAGYRGFWMGEMFFIVGAQGVVAHGRSPYEALMEFEKAKGY